MKTNSIEIYYTSHLECAIFLTNILSPSKTTNRPFYLNLVWNHSQSIKN